MNYEGAWLDSHKDIDLAGTDLFTKVTISADDATDATGFMILDTAAEEFCKGISSISGFKPVIEKKRDFEGVTGTVLSLDHKLDVSDDGYCIESCDNSIVVSASKAAGVLYGVFRLLTLVRIGADYKKLDIKEEPASSIRMLDHWDNPDGSIERGYSGSSFFFVKDRLVVNERTEDYARLVSSVGINAVAINNVNVNDIATGLLKGYCRDELIKMAGIFRRYGIKLFISLNFASPISLGDLQSADPLDEEVRAWWKKAADNIFKDIPDLGGFLVKADSEGRPGPFSYDRTHADGANMLAEAVAPYDGIVIWRCFVYNCSQDWRDKKTDRARACYDNFINLDGQFRENVILQIKNGPMDFQVREPVAPLFGGLKKTNMMIEFQIAQEYTGQQKDLCFLIPQFKEVLDFRTYCTETKDTVKEIVTGRTYSNKLSGMVAVSNTGDDPNWTGHDLAAANLYGYARLAFNPELSAEEIADEWVKLTFGTDSDVVTNITKMLLMSWRTYEKYTSPLGIGWMISPGHHYGPDIEGYEYSPWGTYHRSDRNGLGVERGMSGTGYTSQYNEPNRSMYENIKTCPDELKLFFHRLNYDFVLDSGKTVIEHIYDSHFEGVEEVEQMINMWKSLKDKVDDKRFERVLSRLDGQYKNACNWRDRINTYYFRLSGVKDRQNRTIY